MDRFDALQAFARVVESGSFTKAAHTLHMSRTTRSVQLTADGAAYYPRVVRLLADLEDADASLSSAVTAPRGRLRVDVPSRIGRRLVAPALPGLLARQPALAIELGSTDRAVDLVAEGIDCALRVGALGDSSLVAHPLGRFLLINCASPAYVERWGMPQSPKDLTQHQMVQYLSPSTGQAVPWEWQEEDSRRTLRPAGRVGVNNAETYIACALSGLGLIQIPRFDVQEHLDDGSLVELLPAHRPAPMPVQVVYPHRRHLSRRVQVFIAWMAELLRPHLG